MSGISRAITQKLVKHCGRKMSELVDVQPAHERGWYVLRFGDGDVRQINRRWIR